MAELSGKGGDVTFSSGDDSVFTWTLNYVGDTLETTDFDDSTGGRSYIPNITSWNGSYDCRYSTGNTVVPNTTGSIVLKMSTGATVGWKGNIIITAMTITTPVDGIVMQNYTFQGTGAIAASTA